MDIMDKSPFRDDGFYSDSFSGSARENNVPSLTWSPDSLKACEVCSKPFSFMYVYMKLISYFLAF